MYKLLIFCCLFFFSSASVFAHPGVGIVMNSEGAIFYTDLTHVWKISTDGTRTIAVKNVHTHELYIDDQDTLYGEHEWYEGEATDKWGNYVWCLTKEGQFEKVISDVEGFLDNNTLVRDAGGNSYWSKNSTEGDRLMQQSSTGQNSEFSIHKFRDIRWMHFSKSQNSLYVIDHLAIKKVTPNGSLEVLAENLKENKPSYEEVADRHYLFGLATDSKNNVFVAAYGAQRVKKINSSGVVSTVFESEVGWSPCGVLIAPDNSRWVMEFSKGGKTRVTKINRDGSRIIYGE